MQDQDFIIKEIYNLNHENTFSKNVLSKKVFFNIIYSYLKNKAKTCSHAELFLRALGIILCVQNRC